MKTKVINYAKTLDEAIPDVTLEYAIDKCNKIHKDIKSTFVCMLGVGVCGTSAIVETAELSASVAKTVTKKAVTKIIKVYDETPAITVRR